VWARLRPLLIGRLILTYNADFDLRMLQQTHAMHGLRWSETPETMRFDCLMKLFARYYGEWDMRRNDYRYQSLEAAGKHCGIALPNSHRASDDTFLARALLHSMAETEI
jgi:DNA polymerase-3 subunit epsilon